MPRRWPGRTAVSLTTGRSSAPATGSFLPIVKSAPPEVADAAWVQTEVDRFVLARLEAAGLKPNAPAERHLLIRRAYLDLTGLPPTPEEVAAFLADESPGAFAKVVDRLLASPHYGERWGRHWLDVARYSDGHGGFLDDRACRNAWRYRDWVVEALNADMPYDQFVRQIAGDALKENPIPWRPASLASVPTYISDGGDPEAGCQSEAETLDDRVDTFSRGFLGLTVSCARCHDHKFDPIPHRLLRHRRRLPQHRSAASTRWLPRPKWKRSKRHRRPCDAQDQKLKDLVRRRRQRLGEEAEGGGRAAGRGAQTRTAALRRGWRI